jgi:hypothetical protein
MAKISTQGVGNPVIPSQIHTEKYVLSPLFWFGKLCVISASNFETKNIMWYKFYSIVIIILTLSFCTWSAIERWYQFDQYIYYNVFVFDIVTIVLLPLISVLLIVNAIFIKGKRIKKLLENLMDPDYLVDRVNVTVMQKRRKFIIVELIIVHILMILLYIDYMLSNMVTLEWSFYTDILFYISEYIMAMEVLHICNYALSIRYKIVMLNIALVQSVKQILGKDSRNFVTSSRTPSYLHKHLTTYSKLCNVIDSYNDCFGLQIFGILFVGVIYTTYTIFLIFIYASEKITPKRDVSVVFLLIYYIHDSFNYVVHIFK